MVDWFHTHYVASGHYLQNYFFVVLVTFSNFKFTFMLKVFLGILFQYLANVLLVLIVKHKYVLSPFYSLLKSKYEVRERERLDNYDFHSDLIITSPIPTIILRTFKKSETHSHLYNLCLPIDERWQRTS